MSVRLHHYIIRRVMYAIPTLIGLSIIVFAITRMIGDPVAIYVTLDTPPEMIERIREIYHFNDPIHVQYFYWLQGVLKGDLGYSELVGRPVLKAILAFFPASAEIAIFSITFALLAGIKMGTTSAVNRGTWVDHATRFVSISGRCLPVFWVALVLLYFFYSVLNLISPGRLSLGVFTTQMPPFGSFSKVGSIQKGIGPFAEDLLLHTVEVPKKLDVFSPSEELENGCFLRAHANVFLHLGRFFDDIVAGDGRCSSGGLQQATKHVDCGRFPGAVRS